MNSFPNFIEDCQQNMLSILNIDITAKRENSQLFLIYFSFLQQTTPLITEVSVTIFTELTIIIEISR